MMRSRVLPLVLAVLPTVAAGALVAAPAEAARATGWTAIRSDYTTSPGAPRFAWCEVSETGTKVTLKVRAIRPTQAAVSHNLYWNRKRDFSGQSGNGFSNTWNNNTSIVRVTLPRSSFVTISWQTRQAGYGFTGQRRTPLDLQRCP